MLTNHDIISFCVVFEAMLECQNDAHIDFYQFHRASNLGFWRLFK
jgi:hypothetical protein